MKVGDTKISSTEVILYCIITIMTTLWILVASGLISLIVARLFIDIPIEFVDAVWKVLNSIGGVGFPAVILLIIFGVSDRIKEEFGSG